MRNMEQIVRSETVSLPGGRVLLLLLVMLVALGMAAGGCGVVTGEPSTEVPVATLTATPEPLIVRFEPQLTAQLEYESAAVLIPWQGSELLVQQLTPQADCDPEIRCNRIVIDFKVVEDQGLGDENPLVTRFDPPLQIEVPYTVDDVEDAGGWDNLTLRYWDGELWVAFTESDHSFYLDGDDQGGVGHAAITEWDDREIAWGGPE